ncbi:hypothetical protein C5C66_06320 [Rathayibacter toxicus]|uniref:Uncharacterized protein n=1 Tax=Rathayibacter toxicus TaxID=145458 RepID=A0A0U1PSS6_9MICO|nr:hypothetical protein [Rathayibacter toxicus]ALS58159.1 hypothetical protein APU90_10600 [Rathayibacter toxicus]KKM45366.1 hypothetical protein VT73_06985 [Rathayibacter toxicus]PPG21806.1 hypothetical protein C5D15_06305 [Rathayibacter toxicus]PPG46768.1 hypothetical protein C5D16_06280 [Rathayibacter toxicus]PPH23838.1 hypothetical protein C5D17_06270 [Rathayibacter toxicus]
MRTATSFVDLSPHDIVLYGGKARTSRQSSNATQGVRTADASRLFFCDKSFRRVTNTGMVLVVIIGL